MALGIVEYFYVASLSQLRSVGSRSVVLDPQLRPKIPTTHRLNTVALQ